jgi:hypothetical protein
MGMGKYYGMEILKAESPMCKPLKEIVPTGVSSASHIDHGETTVIRNYKDIC